LSFLFAAFDFRLRMPAGFYLKVLPLFFEFRLLLDSNF
jgi:hypothetical protein